MKAILGDRTAFSNEKNNTVQSAIKDYDKKKKN